ncbi:MAG: DUF4870 domain-containing protein [Leptolyngbya sp. Prado105]|nr:DUF4870 domain-containing protein [Leptolyngbya sp. Prado105]
MDESLEASVRRWGSGCHLVGLFSIVLCAFLPIPFLGALPPYVVWRMGRDRHSFIDEQGREAINFQISMTIYLLVAVILWIFLAFTTCIAAISGVNAAQNALSALFSWILWAGLAIAVLFGLFMMAVIFFGAVKASRGQSYRYPFTIRFL